MLISSFAVFDSVTYSQPTSNPIPANISPGYTTYTINLKGVPSGTGTYTQLITITNPVDYEINNKGTNVLFYSGNNNTELYAWIQSINSTSMSIWVKNYDGNSVIDMKVFPTPDNLCSKTGYLENLDMKFSGVSGLKTNSFYANSSTGDYLNFTMHGNFTRITYYVCTTGLGDFAFFASQHGQGQLVRIDTRSRYYDSTIGSLSSWTSWAQPPCHVYLANTSTWYFVSLTNDSNKWIYDITNESNDTTTHVENYNVSYDGNYFGFIGDALGGSYITYWKDVTFYNSTVGTVGFFDTPSMPTFTISQPYLVTFTENGLPYNSTWYVNITNGQSLSSTTSIISFPEPNGTYAYTVSTSKQGYESSTNSGCFTVKGAPVNISISMIIIPPAVIINSNYLSSAKSVGPYIDYDNKTFPYHNSYSGGPPGHKTFLNSSCVYDNLTGKPFSVTNISVVLCGTPTPGKGPGGPLGGPPPPPPTNNDNQTITDYITNLSALKYTTAVWIYAYKVVNESNFHSLYIYENNTIALEYNTYDNVHENYNLTTTLISPNHNIAFILKFDPTNQSSPTTEYSKIYYTIYFEDKNTVYYQYYGIINIEITTKT